MKRIGTISTVTAVAALVLVAQAFAVGGGMGGGHTGGSMGGGQHMSLGMQGTAGAGMHQGTMNGTGPQGSMQVGTMGTTTMSNKQMNSNKNTATTNTSATTITK